MTRGFLLHLRPPRVPARTLRFTHTFGLGGSSLVLVVLLVATGGLLALVYQPAPATAYDAVVAIERVVAFGPLVRGIHYWSANLLIVVMLAHVARVFLTGAYHGVRRLNWWVGLGLLAGVLASAFTGYLLPWDQRSYWAVTISTSMLGYVPFVGGILQRAARGGAEVGATTLVAFYTLHTTIVPALLAGALAFHFWRVRKAGGVVSPPPREGESGEALRVPFMPDLFVREAAVALILSASVVVLAAVFGAPLGDRANPGMSPNPAKAPWYFMGLQELLIHLPALVAVVVVPAGAALALIALPLVVGATDPAGAYYLWRRAGGTRHDALRAAIVAGATLLAILTVVGVWFRGAFMSLAWPWAS